MQEWSLLPPPLLCPTANAVKRDAYRSAVAAGEAKEMEELAMGTCLPCTEDKQKWASNPDGPEETCKREVIPPHTLRDTQFSQSRK